MPGQPFKWLVTYPPGWFGNFWVGVVVACLNLDASKYLPTNAELDVYIRKSDRQKIELKKIGKDVDVFHELEKQHEACRASFSDLYGAELPTKLQPVLEFELEGMTQAAPTQQQAQARKPNFHTKPSEADVRFTLSKSLMNDTLDVLVQIAHGMQSFAEADIVLMPLYYYSHFIVVVFFVAAGCIVHFDSISKGRFTVTTAQEAVLVEFAQRFIINKK
ncbi:hypothetical protein V8C86DRAFT_3098546 [Haematococcus lacustris]